MTDTASKQIALFAHEAPVRAQRSNYPEPFASRFARREKRPLGDLFALRNFGVNLTTIQPGGVSALRHAHARQDELIYVLEGELVLVTDEGETVLQAGMCAGFPAGSGNAHHFVNRGTAPAVMLEIGDRTPGDTITYPDDDLDAVLSDGRWEFRRKDGSPYR